MQLSKNFSLEELCATNSKLENRPNQNNINSLSLLVKEVLQPLRDLYGKPIHIDSGFRYFNSSRFMYILIEKGAIR